MTWNRCFPHWGHPVVVHPAVANVLAEGPRDEAELEFARQVDAAPKVELHVHAEAAVPASFYHALNADRGIHALEVFDEDRTPFADFRAFLFRWWRNIGLLHRSEDYYQLARALVNDRNRLRIVCTECHFSPLDTSLFRPRLRSPHPVLELEGSIRSFVRGLKEGMAQVPVDVRAVLDLVSIATDEDLDQVYSILQTFVPSAENQDAEGYPILVGIGIGGLEQPQRAAWFAPRLERFRALGLKLDLHSGEQAHISPADHAHSLEHLKPERVGHGFRGMEGNVLHQGHVAACPLSNITLRCHPGTLLDHPIPQMLERHTEVSINTDDPLLLGTTLVLEYVALRRAFGYGLEVFERTQAAARRGRLSRAPLPPGLTFP